MEIKLGQKARDRVTGLTGIINGKAIWLNGCVRWSIQPPVDKEGKVLESYWIDEQQIEILDPVSIMDKKEEKKVAVKKTGGPMERSRF